MWICVSCNFVVCAVSIFVFCVSFFPAPRISRCLNWRSVWCKFLLPLLYLWITCRTKTCTSIKRLYFVLILVSVFVSVSQLLFFWLHMSYVGSLSFWSINYRAIQNLVHIYRFANSSLLDNFWLFWGCHLSLWFEYLISQNAPWIGPKIFVKISLYNIWINFCFTWYLNVRVSSV